MNLQPYVDAGLYDPAAPDADVRASLLKYLDAEGYSLERMVRANDAGRLFGLAGDELLRPGFDQLTLEQAAARNGIDDDAMRRIWRALGFPAPEPGVPVLSPDEADALGIFSVAASFLGENSTMQVARVMSSALRQIAEAENTAVILNVDGMSLESADELTTAQTYAGTVSLVPGLGRVLDALHRLHIFASARRREVEISPDTEGTLRLAVGFVDLVGYTGLSQHLSTAEMGALVTEFEDRVSEVIATNGGRLIKLLGDGAMFVTGNPITACRLGLALVESFGGTTEQPPVRVGITWGDVLPLGGDYYGAVVNLAARVMALAEPGTVLVSASLRHATEAADGIAFLAREAQLAKGIDEPVLAFALARAAAQ